MLTTQDEYRRKYLQMVHKREYDKLKKLTVQNAVIKNDLDSTRQDLIAHLEKDFGIDFEKWTSSDCPSTFWDAALLGCNLNPDDFKLTEDCHLTGFTRDNEWIIPWVIRKYLLSIEALEKGEPGSLAKDPLIARGIKNMIKVHGGEVMECN